LNLVCWLGRFVRDLVLGVIGLALFAFLLAGVYIVHQGNIEYLVETLWADLMSSGVVQCPLTP
jgi:hypothetical protein